MNYNGFTEMTAEEAVSFIKDGDRVGFAAFTPAGAVKVTPTAVANKAMQEHATGRPFRVHVMGGASGGAALDGVLAKADAVISRMPYQSDKDMRKLINEGKVHYTDMHLSHLPQFIRYGFVGKIDVAVIEAADVSADGEILLTTSIGITPTLCRMAEKIIVELNAYHTKELRGIHDIYEPVPPPNRREIPIYKATDRIGEPVIKVDPKKIVGIIHTNLPDAVGEFTPGDECREKIGRNVAEFLAAEMKAGRVPASFLPIQSGVGNLANAVLGAMGEHPDIPAFEMYSEILQDSVIELMEAEKIRFGSCTGLTVTPETLKKIYANLPHFKSKIILRSQEISNHPEITRRLGLISINTALEADIWGNVNSTHVSGRNVMNGIGGSGDFTRNAYISIFTCQSFAKEGKISAIVPLCSHIDHTEHEVQILATEYGVADLRCKSPIQRAEEIISKCAHPDYKDALRAQLTYTKSGHIPLSLEHAFDFHQKFAQTGDMR